MLSAVSNVLFKSNIPNDEKTLIKELYKSGYNHHEISQNLYKHRTLKKVTTTTERCQRDVEEWLLESHRKKA